MKTPSTRDRASATNTELTAKERDQIREVLMVEKQRLLRSAQDGLAYSMNRERNIGRDSIDESMEEEHFSTEMRLRDREKSLLSKIVSAIERLDGGTMNECEECGEPIGFKRLLARPVTTQCIDCKEESEHKEAAQSQVGRAGSIGDADFGMSEDMGGGGGED